MAKARNVWNQRAARGSVDPRFSNVRPGVFKPPPGGYGYYGRGYRYQQASEAYRHWGFVAIGAWMREIAGGEPPKFGRLVPKDSPAGKAVRKTYGQRTKALGGPKEHHEFEPWDDDHPVCRVFANPNGPDVAYDLWAYHTLFKKSIGQSLWWVVRNSFGVPVEIWVIPPHWAQLVTGSDGQPLEYWVQSPWGNVQHIPYDQVVCFYEHSQLAPRYEGFAASQACAEWIDSYESMIRMRLAVWKNGAVPSVHVALGESFADPDEAFLARFYAKWFGRFGGENNSGRPLVTGADVEVKSIDGHRPADALAATNDSEEHMMRQQLAMYGVPKAIVGLTDDMTYGSVEASKDAFREYGVNAELTYTGQVITEKVVKPTPGCEDGVCFWGDRRTGDPSYKLQEEGQHLDKGVKSVNEVRTAHGLEPWPHGGDDPAVNGEEKPWQTGETKEQPLEAAYQRALRDAHAIGQEEETTKLIEGTGAMGGYLTNGSRNGVHQR